MLPKRDGNFVYCVFVVQLCCRGMVLVKNVFLKYLVDGFIWFSIRKWAIKLELVLKKQTFIEVTPFSVYWHFGILCYLYILLKVMSILSSVNWCMEANVSSQRHFVGLLGSGIRVLQGFCFRRRIQSQKNWSHNPCIECDSTHDSVDCVVWRIHALDQANSTYSSLVTCCLWHSGMLPAEIFEMRKWPVKLSLA